MTNGRRAMIPQRPAGTNNGRPGRTPVPENPRNPRNLGNHRNHSAKVSFAQTEAEDELNARSFTGLFRAARAHALTEGRTFLVPDDVKSVVIPCLAHRLLPTGVTSATLEAHAQSAALLEKILDSVEVPA